MLLIQYDHKCCVFLQYNDTALHWAAGYGKHSFITYLVGLGAEVDAINVVSYHCNIMLLLHIYVH